MANRRTTPGNLTEEFNEVYRRLDKIDETISQRVLPVGWVWKLGPSDELIVVRSEDGAQATILT